MRISDWSSDVCSSDLFLVSYGAYAAYYWIYAVDDVSAPEWLRNAVRVVHAIEQWSAIVAVLGFGARHLTRDSQLLRTLTEAVFPFYIAHQTIIVVAGPHLKALALPAPARSEERRVGKECVVTVRSR